MPPAAVDRVAAWWWSPNEKADARGSWDQALLEELLAGAAYDTREPAEIPPEGAVVVIPGQHNVEHVDWISAVIAAMPWALTIITSDEEALFPVERLPRDAAHAVWCQYHDRGVDRVLPVGAPPRTRSILADATARPLHRRERWFFAGQDTHPRRAELINVLDHLPDVAAYPTDGFGPTAQGALSRPHYLRRLASAYGAPCPSGPHSLDSFRLYEALEAGALPVVEVSTPHGIEADFWPALFGVDCPIPFVFQWSELAAIDPSPALAAECQRWWRDYRLNLAVVLGHTVGRLRAEGR